MGEMSDKERIQRSRGLLAAEGDSEKALLQAEQYLRPVNLPFNPATQVLSGERSLQDAISYLDTVILGLFQLEFLPCYNTLLYYHCYWFIYWKINVVPVIKLIHPQIHVSLNGWLLKYKHDATVI